MSPLHVWIEGLGCLGPGWDDWPRLQAALRDPVAYRPTPTVIPQALALPPAERRRAGTPIRLAIAVAAAAAEHAQRDPATLPTVFSASGADGDNCNAICETLASDDRQLSPTRFHNSVHNAPSGYWTIATRSHAASTSLCAHDASLAAGLLETALQARTDAAMLVAYDTVYPAPLYATRPIPHAFALACVLTPHPSPRTFASMRLTLTDAPSHRCTAPAFEALRTTVPTARALPWLDALAHARAGRVVLDYLDGLHLAVDLEPTA